MRISHRIACSRFVSFAIPAFVMALGCWPEMSESAEFALTRDGKPAVTIVIAAVPLPAATFGAQELQLHVQKITGATLPIVSDTEQVAGPRMLLGPSAATSHSDLDASQFEDQEYLIRFLDNDLVLLGKEQATSYAVHDFLERFCNVRWYGPGDSQMVFPETDTLVVEPREVRRRPAFRWSTMFPWTQFKMARELYNQPSHEDLSLFWLRLRMGGEAYACNHSLEGYYDRFWKPNPKHPEVFVAEHPDWFAQGYSASDLEEYAGQPPQLCYSNQGLVDQVVADARRYFDGEGAANGAEAAGKFFAMVPMDRGGGATGASALTVNHKSINSVSPKTVSTAMGVPVTIGSRSSIRSPANWPGVTPTNTSRPWPMRVIRITPAKSNWSRTSPFRCACILGTAGLRECSRMNSAGIRTG